MAFSRFKQRVDRTIAPYLPVIEAKYNEVRDSMGVKSKEAMANDQLMQRLFRAVHNQLPLPLRLAVKQQAFVDFCMRNRDRLRRGDDRDAADGGGGPQGGIEGPDRGDGGPH